MRDTFEPIYFIILEYGFYLAIAWIVIFGIVTAVIGGYNYYHANDKQLFEDEDEHIAFWFIPGVLIFVTAIAWPIILPVLLVLAFLHHGHKRNKRVKEAVEALRDS